MIIANICGHAHQSIFDQIADMHAERLKVGFLPLLGCATLARIYRHAARDPNAILLATVEGDRVLGFAMGATSTRKFYVGFAARNLIPLAWCVAMRPTILLRALSITKYAASSAKGPPNAELLSIAVVQDLDRNGVGSALLGAFRDRLAGKGIASFHVIASDTQGPALAFYRKHGGTVLSQTTLGGLRSYVFLMRT